MPSTFMLDARAAVIDNALEGNRAKLDKAGMDAALFPGVSWRSVVLFGIGYSLDGDHGAGDRRGRLGADQVVRVA